MRLLTAAGLALICSASAALAGSSEWQELAPDTRMRLIASDTRTADGTTYIALEIDMPHSTKTYWRVPGETGIVTEVDIGGSQGISHHRLVWPYPTIETKNGVTDFVYRGPTVIPIELEVGTGAAVVRASVLMGVCSNICVPAMADFTLPLDFSKPDPGHNMRISQALAQAPLPWNGAEAPIGAVALDAASGFLQVPVNLEEVDPDSVIADASEFGHLLGAPQKSPEPGVVALPLIGGDDGTGLEGKPVRLIFMTRNGPYEVTRRVEASTVRGL